ncbi:MAG: protein-L-isoaspartate O-methyltransferase [Croceibacterium sp.]
MTLVEDHPVAALNHARRAMIDSQLRTSGVNADWVLRRMDTVAREDFVPILARGHAYIDRAIALGDGRYLPAPVFHGMMLQEARPTPADHALVVDGGSGYLAELVRPLVGTLETMSPVEAVAATHTGAFTLLLVDGAVEHLPAAMASVLGDGARVVTGWLRGGVTCLAVGRKSGAEVALLPVRDMGIPVLLQFDNPTGWSF